MWEERNTDRGRERQRDRDVERHIDADGKVDSLNVRPVLRHKVPVIKFRNHLRWRTTSSTLKMWEYLAGNNTFQWHFLKSQHSLYKAYAYQWQAKQIFIIISSGIIRKKIIKHSSHTIIAQTGALLATGLSPFVFILKTSDRRLAVLREVVWWSIQMARI